VLPDVFAIPFALSLSTTQFLNSSSIQGDLTVFTVVFVMGACLLVTGISYFINVSSAASGCSSHHRPANIIYIINIRIPTKLIV
jgi:hypothetical protein